MIKKALTLIIAMTSVLAFADNAAVLSKIKNTNTSYKSFESGFKEVKKLKANGKTTEKTGTIYYSSAEKLAMIYKTSGEKFIINGSSVYVNRDGKINNYNADKTKRVGKLKQTLLLSIQGKIQELCNAVGATNTVSEKADTYVVTLNATKKTSKGYTQIELTYTKKDCVLTKMIMTENSGDVTTYIMSGLKKNIAIAESNFVIPKK